MAWGLKFDGVNDYVSGLGFYSTGGAWELKFTIIEFLSAGPYYRIFGGTSASESANRIYTTKNSLTLNSSGPAYTWNGLALEDTEITIVYDGSASGLELFVDGISQGVSGSGTVLLSLNLMGVNFNSYSSQVMGVVSFTDYATPSNSKNFDPTASDHSNTGLQPVLVDTIGSNNATGVNMPTDGSAWVDLGGGAITGSIAFDIVKPVFSVSGAATLPNPISTIDFNVSKPVFASSGAASLPQPSGTIDFNIIKPVFNGVGTASLPFPIATISFDVSSPTFTVTGAATLPNPSGNIYFTIGKPVFNISGAASLPQPIASISFDIDKPTFSAVGSATIPYPQGVVSFDISKPVFAATGVATLPDPVGNIDFTIASPIFLGTGSVSGFIIPTGSIIKVSYGSNMIQLPYTSNTIKL